MELRNIKDQVVNSFFFVVVTVFPCQITSGMVSVCCQHCLQQANHVSDMWIKVYNKPRLKKKIDYATSLQMKIICLSVTLQIK